jgi:plasmid stabilization system protein ParE
MIRYVRFAPSADRQFLHALDYIRIDNPVASRQFRRKVEEVFENVKIFPEMGRIVPEFSGLGFREVIVKPYRFFYDIVGDTIWVVGAWHCAQLPEEPKTVD